VVDRRLVDNFLGITEEYHGKYTTNKIQECMRADLGLARMTAEHVSYDNVILRIQSEVKVIMQSNE
jgi:hypothetical protein